MSKKSKSKAKPEPKPNEPSRAEQVLELLSRQPMTQTAIAKEFGVEGPAVNQVLHKLIKAGKVTRSKDEKQPFLYSLLP